MEATTWKLKTLTKSRGFWIVVYTKGDRNPYSVEISLASISRLRGIASGIELSHTDPEVRELRKLGCISVDEKGRVPKEISLSGLGRQKAMWLNNIDK